MEVEVEVEVKVELWLLRGCIVAKLLIFKVRDAVCQDMVRYQYVISVPPWLTLASGRYSI